MYKNRIKGPNEVGAAGMVCPLPRILYTYSRVTWRIVLLALSTDWLGANTHYKIGFAKASYDMHSVEVAIGS